jgi:hypothetical protein
LLIISLFHSLLTLNIKSMKNLFARAIIIVALIGMNIPSFAGTWICLRAGTLQNCKEELISAAGCYCFSTVSGTDCVGYINGSGTTYIHCNLEIE